MIKDVPIWAFYGNRDKVCPIERDRRLFAELEELGGNMKFTTWAGNGRDVAEKMIAGSNNSSTQHRSDRCDPEPVFLKCLFSNSSPTENRMTHDEELNCTNQG